MAEAGRNLNGRKCSFEQEDAAGFKYYVLADYQGEIVINVECSGTINDYLRYSICSVLLLDVLRDVE